MTLAPLGDTAVLAHLADEAAALRFAAAVRATAPPWLVEVVPAYLSVAVFFDPARVRWAAAADELRRLGATADTGSVPAPGRTVTIPCCYELGPDLPRVAEHTGLSADEVVRLHTGTDYTVYAIGFCPGF